MKFTDMVLVEKAVSKNASHKIIYDTGKLYPCVVQAGVQNIMDLSGFMSLSSAWIAFPPNADISVDDRITLEDGSQPKIMSVYPQKNDITKKIAYIEVFLTKNVPAGSIV